MKSHENIKNSVLGIRRSLLSPVQIRDSDSGPKEEHKRSASDL